jgi:putative ABC transport system substrate-binding protein
MFYEEGLGGLQKNTGEATRLYKLPAQQDSNLEAKRQASEALKRLGAATAAVSPAPSNRAQAAMPVIGILNFGFPNRNADYLVAFRQGLAKAADNGESWGQYNLGGYVEGQNAAIEYRWASTQSERLPALAMDLVQRGVAVIVTVQASSATRAAKAATSSIPIVFAYPGDPVRDGIVASLNHPEGNVTGVTDINAELGGKRLSLLRDLVPQAATVGFLSGRFGDEHGIEEQKSEILDAARV